jgi:ABC-type branched-subunit amino acid transport system substrate-binding protein
MLYVCRRAIQRLKSANSAYALSLLGIVLGCGASACDRALGLHAFQLADAATQPEEPDTSFPQTFSIGMVSSVDDRVVQRQHGAKMAVEVINQAGGVPDGTGRKRTLTLLTATGTSAPDSLHMLKSRGELSAIIGPDSSDHMRELLGVATAEAQLFTVGPNNTVDSIVEAEDSDLSWSLVPTDSQRMPLLMRALTELEASLRAAHGSRELRLSILHRDDAFGRGWRAAIESASWAGVGLLHADNQQRVSIESYDPRARDQTELIARQVAFAPDALVVIGMGEAVTQIMAPLEQLWSADDRPEYLLTDASKGAELLTLIAESSGLMARVRGIGATPTAAAKPSYQMFMSQYAQRFPNMATEPVGVEAASAYDAVFVIAYALAGSNPGSGAGAGPELSRSVRRLAGGALQVDAEQPKLAAAFSALAHGDAINAQGTLSTFAWDSGGGIANGAAELWCVIDETAPRYASTGLTFDISARTFEATASECDPSLPGNTTKAQTGQTQPPAASASAAGAARPPGKMDAGVSEAAAPSTAPLPEYALSVQYQANDTVPDDSSIRPFMRVINALDGEYVPLRELSLRYYIDNEHAERCPDGCVAEVSYAGTQPSGRSVRAHSSFVATSGTLGYLEVSFPGSGSGELAAGETLDVQLHFHTMPYLAFDETNDYSFDARARTFRATERITAHVAGVLVWGSEPAP